MNKERLTEAVQNTLGGDTSKKAAEEAVKAVLENIAKGVKKDGSVQLIGFGTFEVRNRSARTGRNPKDWRDHPDQSVQDRWLQAVVCAQRIPLRSDLWFPNQLQKTRQETAAFFLWSDGKPVPVESGTYPCLISDLTLLSPFGTAFHQQDRIRLSIQRSTYFPNPHGLRLAFLFPSRKVPFIRKPCALAWLHFLNGAVDAIEKNALVCRPFRLVDESQPSAVVARRSVYFAMKS